MFEYNLYTKSTICLTLLVILFYYKQRYDGERITH